MKKTFTLFIAMLTCGLFAEAQYYNEEKHVEKDGTVWYEVTKEISGEYYHGVKDAQKRLIIPIEYSVISYDEIHDDITSEVSGHCFNAVKHNSTEAYYLPNGYLVYQGTGTGRLGFKSLFSEMVYFYYFHRYDLNRVTHEITYYYSEIGVLSPSTGNKFKKIIRLDAPDVNALFSKDHFTAYSESKNIEIIYDVLGDELYRGPYGKSHFDKPIAEITGEKCLNLYNSYKSSNPDKALQYLQIAFDLKYQPAIDEQRKAKYDMALELIKNNSSDAGEIARLLTASALEGYVPAIQVLGSIKADAGYWEEALGWFEKASAAGDGYSSRMAAGIYRDGLGGQCNRTKAKKYYQKAIQQGDTEAKAELNEMENEANRVIKIKGNLPPTVKSAEELEDLKEEEMYPFALQGYLEAIETYCHRMMFFSYGSALWYNEDSKQVVLDEEVMLPANDCLIIKLIPLLKAGATKDANCQFMLACLYSGFGCMGVSTPSDCTYVNVKLAKQYANKFKANPKRKQAHCFGLQKEIVDWMLNNIAKMK